MRASNTVSLLCIVLLLPLGCAQVTQLPQDAALVTFTDNGRLAESDTDSSACLAVSGYALIDIYQAAQSVLLAEGFRIERTSLAAGTVLGSHGMTDADFNLVAGIYFIEEGDRQLIKVVVKRALDLALDKELKAEYRTDWVGRLLKGMRDFLYSANRQNLPSLECQ